jgi:predicted dehydrogenase
MSGPLNRREFLRSSAQNAASAASMAAGVFALPGESAADTRTIPVRTAVIGVRNAGKTTATALARSGVAVVTAVCDVDSRLLGPIADSLSKDQGSRPGTHTDFRRVLDDRSIEAVCIATPDHWHAVMASLAMQAGKHVLVEAPLTLSLEDGRRLAAAAESAKVVAAVALPLRSAPHVRSAMELVWSGQLGRVRLAKAWAVNQRKPRLSESSAERPSDVDYCRWLGPAPPRSFDPARFHYNWRWFWEYGGGELANWGVHWLDVARWGLGLGWPKTVAAAGIPSVEPRFGFETPETLQVSYNYGDVLVTWEHRQWSPHPQEGRSAAAAFYGDRGTLIVDAAGWKVYGVSAGTSLNAASTTDVSPLRFVAAIREGLPPDGGFLAGRISSGLVSLGNAAYRLNRTLSFDPASETVQNDSEAAAMLSPAPRSGWSLPSLA